jgi:hypothetical protein
MSNGNYQNGKLPASALAPIYQGNLKIEAAAGWNAMNVEARKRGVELYPTGSKSSYRTYDQQVELYNAYLNGTGNLAAVPGTSNHGWGDAVDLATQQMRSMVDQIGAQFGYSKSWSDAPSEWWHIVYQSGHYKGDDPGPKGEGTAPTEDDVVSVATARNAAGVLHVFAEAPDGSIWYTYQPKGGNAWHGGEQGKRLAGLQKFAPPPGK